MSGKRSTAVRNTPRRTRMLCGIRQCYLPPGRVDVPALTPAKAGTVLSDPGEMQGFIDLVQRCTHFDVISTVTSPASHDKSFFVVLLLKSTSLKSKSVNSFVTLVSTV